MKLKSLGALLAEFFWHGGEQIRLTDDMRNAQKIRYAQAHFPLQASLRNGL